MNDDELVWGIKASFIRYVREAGGTVTASGGAWVDADDRFHFARTPSPAREDIFAAFAGTVRVQAHHGLLSFDLDSPVVRRQDARFVLAGRLDPADDTSMIDVATLLPVSAADGDDAPERRTFEARLTAEGADAIDPLRYHVGLRVDDVTVHEHTDVRHPAQA